MINTNDVQQFTLFAALDEPTLRDLARRMQRCEYRSGQQIMVEGEPSPGLFGLISGRVRLSRAAPDGRIQVVDTLNCGDLFDLAPVFDGRPVPVSAHAMTNVRCLLLAREDLLQLISSHPDFAHAALHAMAEQLRELLDLVEDLAFRSVRARLARQLLAETANGPAILTQQDLAERAGTVREIAGRALRRMADEGLVRLARGQVHVLDRAGLAQAGEG